MTHASPSTLARRTNSSSLCLDVKVCPLMEYESEFFGCMVHEISLWV
ncbi:hypothetical protein DAI22_07g007900 [Oryza sativa Japonica Group]|nr:hypothetical protein DAI22_07g007900 [Oryza sativa Japonica Group]